MTLYDQLVALCDRNKAFYYRDVAGDWGANLRIFGYRAPSFRDFCEPGALECRGIMYEVDADKRPIRVACRPMEKFFNLGENPMTLNVDFARVARVMTKLDGSLISSFAIGDRLMFKSKSSVSSVQACDAGTWVRQVAPPELVEAIRDLTLSNHTVNMEWTAPFNRIVLKYQEPRLTILNIRHNITGDYLKMKTAWQAYPILKEYWVDGTCLDRLDEAERMSYSPESIKKMEGVEGFIYVLDNGQMIKVKTDWYCNIHRAKDAALNFRAVLEAVLYERSDDLRQVLGDDKDALKLLNRVELKVRPWMSEVMAKVDSFYEANRGLDRKSYAIKGQKDSPEVFPLLMLAYQGREPAYAEFAMKRYEDLKSLCGVEGFNGLSEESG